MTVAAPENRVAVDIGIKAIHVDSLAEFTRRAVGLCARTLQTDVRIEIADREQSTDLHQIPHACGGPVLQVVVTAPIEKSQEVRQFLEEKLQEWRRR